MGFKLPVASLIRTILSRPDLAHKVEQLDIKAGGTPVYAKLDNLCGIPLSNTTTATKAEARLNQANLARVALLKLPSVKRMFINTLYL